MTGFTQNDLVYLLKQKPPQLDMIIAGMAAILSDTEKNCEALKNQNWAKRMYATVLGTKKNNNEIIRNNNSAICAYCLEALTELFGHQRVSSAMEGNLKEQVKEVYAARSDLKYPAGLLVKKLEEKVENTDRYFTLYKEIELGRYGSDGNPFWFYRTMAEIDEYILRDDKKMELLTDLLYEKQIISKEPMSTEGFVLLMLEMPDEHAGAVYMELLDYSGIITADLAMAVIECWHMQPRANKQYQTKELVATRAIEYFGIEPGVMISQELEFNTMIETKKIRLDSTAEAEIVKKVDDLEREARQKERQQEIQANVQRNMQGLKTNAQGLQENVSKNMKKGMHSLKGFFGNAKDNVVKLAGKKKEA